MLREKQTKDKHTYNSEDRGRLGKKYCKVEKQLSYFSVKFANLAAFSLKACSNNLLRNLCRDRADRGRPFASQYFESLIGISWVGPGMISPIVWVIRVISSVS